VEQSASLCARDGTVAVMADEPTELTYEQARDELVAIVTRLEAGGTMLEESLALWERGEELAGLCEQYLENARARLDAATARRSGPAATGDTK
jgi:exodeoxyribonuclease VII small subunit